MLNQAQHEKYLDLKAEETARAQEMKRLESAVDGRAAEMAAKYPVINFTEAL